MKKASVFLALVFLLLGAPLQYGIAASDANNGHHYGQYKNPNHGHNHGTPDLASIISLLGIGTASVGAYSLFLRRRHKQ